MGSSQALGVSLRALNSLSIIRTKSLVQRESHSDTGGDIDMSSTSPPPHKRKLSRPEADTSAELKKQKLTENDTNTLPPKTATEDEDMGNDGEVSSGDLKPPKKTTFKKFKTANTTKLGAAVATSSSKPANASEEFPNGHLYCHQCNKKRDVSRESHLSRSLSLDCLWCSLRPHRGHQLHRGCE